MGTQILLINLLGLLTVLCVNVTRFVHCLIFLVFFLPVYGEDFKFLLLDCYVSVGFILKLKYNQLDC